MVRNIMKPALVITSTIGAPELARAYESVFKQDYTEIYYLVVIDGPEYQEKAESVLNNIPGIKNNKCFYKCVLPFNTGRNGYYGHRIIAGFAHLTDFEYICLLDQDNWYEPNHVSSLIEIIEKNNCDWSYSLRKIYDENNNFVCNDDCASLGHWSVYGNGTDFLIDTSCYCYTNKFYRIYGTIWDYGWGADGRFCTTVQKTFKQENFECTGLYTLNYQLHESSDFNFPEYFKNGNKLMEMTYGKNNLPWRKREQ